MEETILSPTFAIFCIAIAVADWPEAVANAATPPSNTASRFSNTSVVGFIIRVYIFPSSDNENKLAAC